MSNTRRLDDKCYCLEPHCILSLGKDEHLEHLCVSGLHLLPIQELHERPQHGVSICLCSVVVGRAFDLVEDLCHLTHAAGDASLETGGRGNKVRGEKFFLPGTQTLCVFV